MSDIKQKLKENRNRRARERFLDELSERNRCMLSSLEFTSSVSCLKYAAFPTWDMELDCQTTTRGNIDGWTNEPFNYWDDLVDKLKQLDMAEDIEGWFFIDIDGPYCRLSWKQLKCLFDDISSYARKNDHYDYGWIGERKDLGLIVEFNQTSFCRNEFEISKWGF